MNRHATGRRATQAQLAYRAQLHAEAIAAANHKPSHETHVTIVAGVPVQWITWREVDRLREKPARDRRIVRSDRFADLEAGKEAK